MKRWIATMALALLLSNAAAADPEGVPAVDLTATWASVEQRIDAEIEQKVDAYLERALRHHAASAEALRDVSACNLATSPPEAGTVSATERHRHLTECLAQRRAKEGLVAASPSSD